MCCTLDVLHVLTRHLHQIAAMPHQDTHCANAGVWPEGAVQQAHGVQVLNPLAFVIVRAFAGHVLHVPRIHQLHLQAVFLEHLIDGNPIHSRRLHGHGLDSATHQPSRHRLQLAGEGPTLAYRMLVAIGRHGHEDLARPDVTTRCVWLTLAFDRLRLGCLPSCYSRLGTVIWFRHAHAPFVRPVGQAAQEKYSFDRNQPAW